LNALTYKLQLWHTGTFSGYLGQGQGPRSWDQAQGHMSVTKYTHMWLAFD